jgi:hypothetical protein
VVQHHHHHEKQQQNEIQKAATTENIQNIDWLTIYREQQIFMHMSSVMCKYCACVNEYDGKYVGEQVEDLFIYLFYSKLFYRQQNV